MTVDRSTAEPGEVVTFTIDVSGIPSGTTTLTVEDTVPAGLRIESSVEPSACSRTDATWSCTPGTETALSIRIHTIVEESARGKELVNKAVIDARSQQRGGDSEDEGEHDSDDENDDGGGESSAVNVEASVRIIASDISIRLGATQSVARPGEPLNYRIELENRGAGPAVDASVVARLPAGVISDSVYPRPTTSEGDRLTWSLAEIPVGSYVYMFNASFAPSAIVSHILASASVSYVDSNGDSPQLLEAVLSLPVAAEPPSVPSAPESAVPLGAIGMMFAASAAGLLLVQRFVLSPRPARLRIDQMFLLHRSGLLMKHFSGTHLGARDPDIQGAMLTAVQNYLENSVDASAGPLRQITFGGRDIIFANGGNAILAAVIRKGDPSVFFARAPRFLADLEARGGDALANWDGVAERLNGVDGAFRDFTKGLLAHRGA
jgi:uncharacterized repeat protein (TIGR01451 family)